MNETAKTHRTAWQLWRRNLVIWGALMALLIITLVAAYIPLGPANTAIGVAIAAAKAGLVLMLFMELVKAKSLIRLAAVSGLVFVTVLFALSLADVLSRY
ncbi:cytochrome C oxidase subunit IV family protein [Micromonospora sp. STR1s_5]|nr:cytochrome C oxidase subunit IV family protein [Micromonospora sp. STR1s_5]